MSSEWLKVMLEEIERKRTEAEQARIEESLRASSAVPHEPSAVLQLRDDAE